MNAKLQAGERITLLGLIPSEANLVTMRIVQELKRKLGISAEEYQSLEMKIDEEKEQAKWNPAKDLARDFDFAEVEMDVVQTALRKLDKDAKITEVHLSLCEKFKV